MGLNQVPVHGSKDNPAQVTLETMGQMDGQLNAMAFHPTPSSFPQLVLGT